MPEQDEIRHSEETEPNQIPLILMGLMRKSQMQMARMHLTQTEPIPDWRRTAQTR
jgi:hypothetical protein